MFKYTQSLPFVLSGLLTFAACQEKDIDSYDTDKSYIYFDIPYLTNAQGDETSLRLDSISCSFALAGEAVTDTIIPVVVKTIGTASDRERPYQVQLIDEKTTAKEQYWNPEVLQNRTIQPGMLTDTIRIHVTRDAELKDTWAQVWLRIIPNEHFAPGYEKLQTVKVSFSDILAKPDWWSAWEGLFGPFYREVYEKWIEIYYLGADSNVHPGNGELLYWDNMPPSYIAGQYPVLDLYLGVLKDYFNTHDVYPDGDTSKQPIRLPR